MQMEISMLKSDFPTIHGWLPRVMWMKRRRLMITAWPLKGTRLEACSAYKAAITPQSRNTPFTNTQTNIPIHMYYYSEYFTSLSFCLSLPDVGVSLKLYKSLWIIHKHEREREREREGEKEREREFCGKIWNWDIMHFCLCAHAQSHTHTRTHKHTCTHTHE